MICAAIVAHILIGCKPTEKNYQAAYDAAQAKRAEAASEQMRPATGLLSDDGPQRRVLDGDTIYVLSERTRTLDGQKIPGKFSLVVGSYKMDTNAKASATDLTSSGYPGAFAAKGFNGKYFTIVTTSSSMDSIRMESKKFKKKFRDYPYVGLPGAPVILSHH